MEFLYVRGAQQTIYYDAGLILKFGFNPPVGIVRVEHGVAEFLARQIGEDLRFIVFDPDAREYRPLSPAELALMQRILFERHRPVDSAVDRPGSEDLQLLVPSLPPDGGSSAVRTPLRKVAREVRRLVKQVHGLTRIAAAVGRKVTRKIRKKAGKLDRWFETRGDTFPVLKKFRNKRLEKWLTKDLTGCCTFQGGDRLVMLGNAWDYMDYGYLTRIVRQEGVRLVSAIHDVIAMELPFTTPVPIHIYHRHWVELGHLSAHLVAVSRHSLDSYRRFIADPNDLAPAMSYAHLPSLLRARSAEIGELAVPELLDRSFVVFCSTIETRKNHQLLLHAWDRLRKEIDPEKLPVLVFVGNWGWGTETVRLLSERNWRLRGHLKILTGISDSELIWLYRNARFTVFPSFAEGFGLAAAESLSFGTPVVVSHCPALMEASEGLMPAIDPMDLPSWLAELRRLILDDAYLEALRDRAAQYEGAPSDGFARAILDAVLLDRPAGAGAFGKKRIRA